MLYSNAINYIYPNNNYSLYRVDRNSNSHGGGILVYVNSVYNSYQINLNNDKLELIYIKVFNFRLCVFYRPPSMDNDNTIILCNLMTNIMDTDESTVIKET